MTHAERFAGKNPVGVLCLTTFHGLAIMDVDPYGEWVIVAWYSGENYSGFYRHKLSYDDKKDALYFYKGRRKWYLNDFVSTLWRG